MINTKMKEHHFAVCIKNDDYQVSLEKMKIYQILSDPEARKHRQVRIVDESGEDYLYPEDFFVPIDLPDAVQRAAVG
jgi:hypothetical protein